MLSPCTLYPRPTRCIRSATFTFVGLKWAVGAQGGHQTGVAQDDRLGLAHPTPPHHRHPHLAGRQVPLLQQLVGTACLHTSCIPDSQITPLG